MKLIYMFSFLLVVSVLSSCASNISSNKSVQDMIAAANENSKYVSVMNKFMVAAKNKNITEMLALTSASSIKMYGLSSYENNYKNILIPEITSCNKIYTNKNIMLTSKEATRIGKGYIYQKICTKEKGKPSIVNIKVLNDNGHIAVAGTIVFKPNKKMENIR